jgi:hypothetical protein
MVVKIDDGHDSSSFRDEKQAYPITATRPKVKLKHA